MANQQNSDDLDALELQDQEDLEEEGVKPLAEPEDVQEEIEEEKVLDADIKKVVEDVEVEVEVDVNVDEDAPIKAKPQVPSDLITRPLTHEDLYDPNLL
jgi:hypothetical protein